VFSGALPTDQVDALLRQAGKGLADEVTRGHRPTGTLQSRVEAASELLNEQLGALTHLEGNGHWVIRGAGCPLSALTGKHPAVCLAIESMVAEVIGTPVRECCDRSARPRCCFEIAEPRAKTRQTTRQMPKRFVPAKRRR
jgi:predicted ArsR family transcriptional regulator